MEYNGLGRYEDSPNRWGHLIAMARIWCSLKPGGRALVGLPTVKHPMEFNANCINGKVMHSHMFTNWSQIYRRFGDSEKTLNHNNVVVMKN